MRHSTGRNRLAALCMALASAALILLPAVPGVTDETQPAGQAGEVDAVTGPTWTIELSGYRSHQLQTYEVRKMMDEQGLARAVTVTERGAEVEYTGVPLSSILGYVDSAGYEDPWQVDQELWESGYDVTVSAMDGYAATFNTAEFELDQLIFAMTRDGDPVYPRITGDSPRSLWVKDLMSIEAALGERAADAARAAFTLGVTANGETVRYTLDEMDDLTFYRTGTGQYTTSAGVEYQGEYGGVLLRDLLEQFVIIEPETSVTFVAVDGYEMTYSGEQILDESDGRWILAIEKDGEPLPVDPGYIRTIKIGPEVPNIPGHLSVRMIAEIIVEGETYDDFSLEITGPMNNELDRSTLQSTLAFTGQTVTFTHRGETNEYTGIPLYELLAFSDDPDYAPHRQDSSIDPYNREAALAGYDVTITASDGFSITLNSRDLHENDDVILAMKKNGEELPENEWPLIVVWDESLDPRPDGIKNVRNVARIELDM